MEKHYDLLIIGGGPGGYGSALYAAKKGLKVALVEKEKLGGTCLNIGCIPTKTIIQSSSLYENILNSKEFGISVDNVSFDMNKIIERKDNICEKLRNGIAFSLNKSNVEIINGIAKFVDDKIVRVNDTKIKFNNLIIATGSTFSNIAIPGINNEFVINSTQALQETKIPKSITIIGGGVIGMEFAFIYKNLGVDVTVIEYLDRILSTIDLDGSKEILKLAKRSGIKILLSSKVENINKSENNTAIVTYTKKEKKEFVESEKVLLAIGRVPNIEGLEISNTSIKINKNAIIVDEHMKTNVDNIYAIGDVTNIMQLAHIATYQGIIAVENILNNPIKANYDVVPNVIFTNPEISSVGLIDANNDDYISSKYYFRANGKAQAMNETNGFVKLIKDKKQNVIVGATIVGPDASTLISILTLAINKGMNEEDIIKTIFPHPTTSEAIHEAATLLQ
ncbi:MAG: dihydrolipoyl dehydrogenase [Erysipelotrichaceae bacterium]|nr:dihydrolipoyl dehydrogenase [Erysipelotrichaceae bacterium]